MQHALFPLWRIGIELFLSATKVVECYPYTLHLVQFVNAVVFVGCSCWCVWGGYYTPTRWTFRMTWNWMAFVTILSADPGADHGKEAGPPYGTGDRVGCVLDTDIPSGTTAAALIAPNRSITASLGLQCAGFTMASSARQASES